MKQQLISYIILLFLLFSCKKKETESLYINEWKSTEKPIPYFAKLNIKKDRTFSFSGGACTANFESVGKWKIINDTLVLTSIEVAEQLCKSNFKDNCLEIDFVKLEDSTTTKKNCEGFEHNYIVFNNEKFYYSDDTLKHISQSNPCEFDNNFIK